MKLKPDPYKEQQQQNSTNLRLGQPQEIKGTSYYSPKHKKGHHYHSSVHYRQ